MAEQMLSYMYIHTYIDTVITPPDGVGVGQAGQQASKLVGDKNMVGTLIFLPTVGQQHIPSIPIINITRYIINII